MSDQLAAALARLAPTVDVGTSRELFERERDGGAAAGDPSPRRDRWMRAAACVVLLVAGVAGVWALSGRDEAPPAAAPAPDGRGDGTEFRLIAREPVGDFDRRAVRAADSVDALSQLLGSYRDSFDRFAGELDERNEVAVVIERSDNSCPVDVERFTPVDDVWRVAWADKPGGDCEDAGYGWVYLLAVRRDALGGITEFVLPAEQLGARSWEELRVAVPGTARPPVPSADELAEWLARFPSANDFDPDDLAQLIEAHERGEDWTGTLSGTLFEDAPTGEWWLCSQINESLPPQCGSGIRLASQPDVRGQRPDAFDEVMFPDTDDVAVVISREPIAVTGTWFDDAAIFVEDRTTAPDADATPVADAEIQPGRIALVYPTSAPFGQVLAAGEQTAYDQMWAQVGPGISQPAIDFGREIAVAFVVRDDACAPEFDGFDTSTGSDGSIWTPVLRETSTTCRLPLVNRLILVAVGRDRFGDSVTFRLPANPLDGYDEQLFTLDAKLAISDFGWGCRQPTGWSFSMTFQLQRATELHVDVLDGAALLGSGTLGSAGAGPFTIEFNLTSPPAPTAEAVVTDGTTGVELARVPLAGIPIPTCA